MDDLMPDVARRRARDTPREGSRSARLTWEARMTVEPRAWNEREA